MELRSGILAAALTALLVLGALWNLRRVDALCADIQRCIDQSEQALSRRDEEEAKAALDSGLELWLAADGYTHIFIRHTEIDSTTDAFYEALEELTDGDNEASGAAIDKLRYHLDSICRMEHLSLGSIM